MPESSVDVSVGELGLVVSAGRLLAVLGRGQQATLEMGHGRRDHAVTVPPGWASRVRRPQKQRLESGRHVYGITNGSVDRRQPGMFQRWAMCFNCSVVGPKPPKKNCRWGPKILGARCGRATCAGPKPGLLVKDEGLE